MALVLAYRFLPMLAIDVKAVVKLLVADIAGHTTNPKLREVPLFRLRRIRASSRRASLTV